MAIECIGNCPRIKDIQRNIAESNMWAGPGPIHADALADLFGQKTDVDLLLDACQETYQCPGPRIETRQVKVSKGFLKGEETINQDVIVCGLEPSKE